jgi:copper(I)-binding protein
MSATSSAEVGRNDGVTRRRMAFLAMMTLAMLVACGGDGSGATDDLAVTDAWMRPTPAGQSTVALYATVTNDGATPTTLRSVRTDLCAETQLHMTTTDAAGVARMSPLDDGILIPAGTSVVLGPGGLHVMCLGIGHAIAEGDTEAATFAFDDTEATVDVTVSNESEP